MSSRGSKSVLAIRLFNNFHPSPILNDNELINFTAPETTIPENTTTTRITTSPLPKKSRRSTSSSTITKPQIDQNLNSQVIDQSFIIETLREELKAMVQTMSHNQGYPTTTTTTTVMTPTTNSGPTTTTNWYSADSPNENMVHNDNHLPPLPESTLPKIKQGKFINFDLLLPQAFTPSASDDYVVQLSNNEDDLSSSSITLVPKSQSNRAKVVDFNTWLQAWCVFVRVYCSFHSHRVQEVLHYQTIMAQYGHQYVFPEFYLFDRQFRLRMANNNFLRWDRFDFELVGRFLRTFRPVCFRCRNFGHYAQACPRVSSSYLGGHSSPYTGGRIPPRFRNAPPAPGYTQSQFRPRIMGPRSEFRPPAQHTCWYFNSNGFCNNPRCGKAHVCSSCGDNHPLSHCTQRSTARF